MTDIQTKPDETTEITKATETANKLLFEAEDVAKITDADGEAKAAAFIGNVKEKYNSIESMRVAIVKPLKDHADNISTGFKGALEPLKRAENIVKEGVMTYRAKLAKEEQERQAAETKRQQESEEAAKASAALGVEVEAPAPAPVHVPAPKPVVASAGGGRMQFTTTTKVEITDEKLVPREYCTADMSKVKAALKLGVKDIPGVTVTVGKKPSFYGA